MAAVSKEIEIGETHVLLTKLDYIEKGIETLDAKIEKLDGRQWQIIILLLSYPLGLIIGKLVHLF